MNGMISEISPEMKKLASTPKLTDKGKNTQ